MSASNTDEGRVREKLQEQFQTLSWDVRNLLKERKRGLSDSKMLLKQLQQFKDDHEPLAMQLLREAVMFMIFKLGEIKRCGLSLDAIAYDDQRIARAAIMAKMDLHASEVQEIIRSLCKYSALFPGAWQQKRSVIEELLKIKQSPNALHCLAKYEMSPFFSRFLGREFVI